MQAQQVTMHYDRGSANPAVCVKVYDPTPSDKILRAVAHGYDYDPDDFVAFFATLSDETLWTFHGFAAEVAFEDAQSDADYIFDGCTPKVYQEGRSGGWLTVHGLPDPEEWTAPLHVKWQRFEAGVKAQLAAFPELLATLVAINAYDQHLAEQEEARRYHETGRWEAAFSGTPLAGMTYAA